MIKGFYNFSNKHVFYRSVATEADMHRTCAFRGEIGKVTSVTMSLEWGDGAMAVLSDDKPHK